MTTTIAAPTDDLPWTVRLSSDLRHLRLAAERAVGGGHPIPALESAALEAACDSPRWYDELVSRVPAAGADGEPDVSHLLDAVHRDPPMTGAEGIARAGAMATWLPDFLRSNAKALRPSSGLVDAVRSGHAGPTPFRDVAGLGTVFVDMAGLGATLDAMPVLGVMVAVTNDPSFVRVVPLVDDGGDVPMQVVFLCPAAATFEAVAAGEDGMTMSSGVGPTAGSARERPSLAADRRRVLAHRDALAFPFAVAGAVAARYAGPHATSRVEWIGAPHGLVDDLRSPVDAKRARAAKRARRAGAVPVTVVG